MLSVLATPIGNLGDMTHRSVEELKQCDYVLCEDNRVTARLLRHYEISKKLVVYNDINKSRVTPRIIQDLKDGLHVCLVTDAGTPCISDPGFYVLRAAHKAGLQVSPIPGVSALTAALSIAGVASDRFTFYGFLSKTSGKLRKELEMIEERNETAVVYESPNRILKLLNLVDEIMPDRRLVVCRELTKRYETLYQGTASELLGKLKTVKGEIVLLIDKNKDL